MASIFLVNRGDYLQARASLGPQLAETECLTNSADVYNALVAEGMPRVTFVDAVPHGAADLARCHFEADRMARAFDAQLSELRTRHLGFALPSLGWDYLNIYFIALTLLRWSRFAPQLAAALPQRPSLAYFTVDNSQDFYFDSALQRHYLGAALRQRTSGELRAFPVPPNRPFVAEAAQFEFDLRGDEDSACEALVHLPTVYYDYEHHRQRLGGFHAGRLVDLSSAYFDIPIAPDRVALKLGAPARAASLAQQHYLDGVRAAAGALYQCLCPGLPPAIAAAQVERQVAKSLSQLRAFDQLCTAPKFANIRYVYLSDHDAGLSGPVATWASLRGLATEIHPHSSVAVTPFPVIPGARKHGYVREPDSFADLGNERSVWAHRLLTSASPEQAAQAARRTPQVLLLLNALTDPGGVPTCSFPAIARFMAEAIALCARYGVRCKVRSKASWDFSIVLASQLRAQGTPEAALAELFATGPLEPWAESTTICIALDQPTTALIKFLNAGAFCVQAIDRPYTETELHTLPDRDVLLSDYNGAMAALQAQLTQLAAA
ncbi:hypothetical protein ASC94_30730 [Massilia sp. Root418]|uniref:hypothetical protein n=1 Tax=Massilia sp. Root418 TaxID=1736532 RepID=UPI0006F3459C|nr:hypothetical protein [Massilia sp. Root418]KQW99915.1 hypothetical protein ASC94_30730 [Massilia sp. Root418]